MTKVVLLAVIPASILGVWLMALNQLWVWNLLDDRLTERLAWSTALLVLVLVMICGAIAIGLCLFWDQIEKDEQSRLEVKRLLDKQLD